jgi:phosphate transport system protein
MKEKFDQFLEQIKKELIFMAKQVEDALYVALKSLEKQDIELAKSVFEIDRLVDHQEVKIEEDIISLLALFQPVATDLRFIIGALKMNNDMERIGDHTSNIAKTTIKLAGEPYIKPLIDIPRMGKLVKGMLHDAVYAFINQDTDLATDVCKRDDEVDHLYKRVKEDVVEVVKDKIDKLEQGVELISVARNLERIADLSTNLSEEVVFMRDAKIIRHQQKQD